MSQWWKRDLSSYKLRYSPVIL